MSASTSTEVSRKRKVSGNVDVTASDDHRKRRRNRTTQSCLNCHGSKRMCDRKRPACGRCVKLGLSGLCVYEVDDPKQREGDRDDAVLLKSRIAELEGFIREFKKKPHPRWTLDVQESSNCPVPSTSRATSVLFDDTSSDTEEPARRSPSLLSTGGCNTPSTDSETSSDSKASPMPTTPPAHDDSPILLSAPGKSPSLYPSGPEGLFPHSPSFSSSTDHSLDVSSLFSVAHLDEPEAQADIFDDVFARLLQWDAKQAFDAFPRQGCDYVEQPDVSAVLSELAPHVRKALDTLETLPDHAQTRQTCDLLRRVKDACISTPTNAASLSNLMPSNPHQCTCKPRSQAASSTFPPAPSLPWLAVAPSSLSLQRPQPAASRSWNTEAGFDARQACAADRLMTWEPPAVERAEWPRTILL